MDRRRAVTSLGPRRLGLAILLLLVSGTGCGDDDKGRGPTFCETQARQSCAESEDRLTCEAEQVSLCVNDRFFGGTSAVPVPDCSGGPPGPLAISGAKQLILFRHSGTPEAEAIAETRGLQRYYAEHALEFYSELDALPTHLPNVMEGNQAEFTEAIIDAGVPIGGELTPKQQAAADTAIARVMFRSFRRFMNAHGAPGPGMNVTVIPNIVSDELAEMMGEGADSIAGLGVSPALLALEEQDDPNIELAKLLGLPSDFKPSIFVGHQVMLKYAPEYYDYIIAHEVGHAFGLQHTYDLGNLMKQGGYDCRPYLEQWQVASLVGVEAPRVLARELPAASQSLARSTPGLARSSGGLARLARTAIARVREAVRQAE